MVALGSIPRPGDALEQQLEESFLRQPRQQNRALAEIAADRHERLQVYLALDPLSDRCAAEPMRKIDHGLADRRIGGVERTIAREVRADLELGEGQRAQARKGGIATPEIIDGDLH